MFLFYLYLLKSLYRKYPKMDDTDTMNTKTPTLFSDYVSINYSNPRLPSLLKSITLNSPSS